jgi:phosphotransferase system HPr-like phosphotransfer protein
MYKKEIKIDTPEKAKSLCHLLRDINSKATLSSGKYIVDAKSILGVLTLNLAKPVTLTIEDNVSDRILSGIGQFEF